MKNITVLLGLLLCFCASSWGACISTDWGVTRGNTIYRCGCPGTADGSCPSVYRESASVYRTAPRPYLDRACRSQCGDQCGGEFCNWQTCEYTIECTTQAEADSATIAQKCATGTMVKDTVGDTIFDACQNGEGLLIAFNNPITGVHNASIGYYIVTDDSADSLDEATYNHLASLACTEVSLYRGVLNGKYVYWYSTDPEPAGVVNVVRIK